MTIIRTSIMIETYYRHDDVFDQKKNLLRIVKIRISRTILPSLRIVFLRQNRNRYKKKSERSAHNNFYSEDDNIKLKERIELSHR